MQKCGYQRYLMILKKIKKFLVIFFFFIFSFLIKDANATILVSGDNLSGYRIDRPATNLILQLKETSLRGITFNNDGSKMYIIGEASDSVHEYNLASNFNITSFSFVQSFSVAAIENQPISVKFNNNGSKMFIIGRQRDRVQEYILSKNFDVSTAVHESFYSVNAQDNTPFGLDFSTDGKMMYMTGLQNQSMHQYSLNVAFDLSEGVNFLRTEDLPTLLDNEGGNEDEPTGIEFSPDGTKLFMVGTRGNDVNQYTLSTAFDISTATFDGGLEYGSNPSGIHFGPSGLKMFITGTTEHVREHNLPCPYNFFAGKCPSITSDPDRAGIAEAQVESAKRAINMSTNSALNRLKWIRRNKDEQNLTDQNAKLNFSGTMFSSLNPLPFVSFKKISNHITNNKYNKSYFYWSEGDISLGRISKTSNSSKKESLTNAITYGVDRFKDDNGVEGFAFRYGIDDIDVGYVGSNLDTRTYNITYYNTTPIKNDTKYIDKIFGIGRIESDILTKLDGLNITADRTGHQIYGTLKLKDEYKKNDLTFIPSGQIDLGHTKLDGYQEVGSGAIRVKDQHVKTQNLRATMAIVEDLSTDKYIFKRHSKIEYLADTDRSSRFKYDYVIDKTSKFNDTLKTGALHNFNFETGVDIIFPERFSLFLIYERNQALDYSGSTDNLYLAIGYLPSKDTEYAFSLNGSENLLSKFEIKKNINDYNINFNLVEDLMDLGKASGANMYINKVF